MKAFFGLAVIGLWIAGAVGYVLNIVDLFSVTFDPLKGVVVLKVVGIFLPPLGAILGYAT